MQVRGIFVALVSLPAFAGGLTARADYRPNFTYHPTYYYGYPPQQSEPIISLTLDPQEEIDADFRIAAREDRRADMLRALAKKAEINSRSDEGMTALMYAARNCSLPIVKALIKHGADVNVEDNDGRTALIFGARDACAPVIRVLLRVRGIETKHRDKSGQTALDYAIRSASLDVGGQASIAVRLLSRAGARP